MSTRKKILTAWEQHWERWLKIKLVPHQKQLAAQEEKLQQLLQRCENLEQQIREQKENAVAMSLWQEFGAQEVGVGIIRSAIVIHPVLCVEDGCTEKRFRKNRCLEHYEQYNRSNRFVRRD